MDLVEHFRRNRLDDQGAFISGKWMRPTGRTKKDRESRRQSRSGGNTDAPLCSALSNWLGADCGNKNRDLAGICFYLDNERNIPYSYPERVIRYANDS